MELWIRSQDKKTLKLADNLDIYSIKDEEGIDFFIEESGTTLGCYKTEERALEVLDEIQTILKPKFIVNTGEPIDKGYLAIGNEHICFDTLKTEIIDYSKSPYVYEMPEE